MNPLTITASPGTYAYAPASELLAYVDDSANSGQLLVRDAGGRGVPRELGQGARDFEVTSDGKWTVYATGDPYGLVAAQALGGNGGPVQLSEHGQPYQARGTNFGVDRSLGYYQSAGWDGTGGVTVLEESKETVWHSLADQRETLIQTDTMWPMLTAHHPMTRLIAYVSKASGVVYAVRSLGGGSTTDLSITSDADQSPTDTALRFTPNGRRVVVSWHSQPFDCVPSPNPCPPPPGGFVIFLLAPTPVQEHAVLCPTCGVLTPLDTGVLFIEAGQLHFLPFDGVDQVLEPTVAAGTHPLYRIDKTRWVYNVLTGDGGTPMELRLVDLADAMHPVARTLGQLRLAGNQFSGAGLELLPGESVHWLVVRDTVTQQWGLYNLELERLVSTPYADWRPLRVVGDATVIYGRVKTSTDSGAALAFAELAVGPLPAR